MVEPMLGLTILQPFPWAICRGWKGLENRERRPDARAINQRIAIHAGLSTRMLLDPDVRAFVLARTGGETWPSDLALGAIVGTALLAGWVEHSTDPWFTGKFGWRLEAVRTLARPIACRGALGLWKLPPDVEALVRAQEAARAA